MSIVATDRWPLSMAMDRGLKAYLAVASLFAPGGERGGVRDGCVCVIKKGGW